MTMRISDRGGWAPRCRPAGGAFGAGRGV